jgi:hypothetical protein
MRISAAEFVRIYSTGLPPSMSPPFLEGRRPEIEAALPELNTAA